MVDPQRLITPSRKTYIGGLVTGLILFFLLNAIFANHGGTTFYPTRIDKSAKGLVESVGCALIGPGTFLVSGLIIANAESGIFKIGATIYFGNQGQANAPTSIRASPTYFDTNDPSVGSLIPQFSVVADVSGFVNTPAPLNVTPKYCEIFVSERL